MWDSTNATVTIPKFDACKIGYTRLGYHWDDVYYDPQSWFADAKIPKMEIWTTPTNNNQTKTGCWLSPTPLKNDGVRQLGS